MEDSTVLASASKDGVIHLIKGTTGQDLSIMYAQCDSEMSYDFARMERTAVTCQACLGIDASARANSAAEWNAFLERSKL